MVVSGFMFGNIMVNTMMANSQGGMAMQHGNAMMSSSAESTSKSEPKSSATIDDPSAPVVTIVRGASILDDKAYSPNPLVVKVGTKVRFVNEDPVPHTVTEKNSDIFDSGVLNKGEVWEFTFDKTGTYDYYCMLHHNMVGTIQVLE